MRRGKKEKNLNLPVDCWEKSDFLIFLLLRMDIEQFLSMQFNISCDIDIWCVAGSSFQWFSLSIADASDGKLSIG